MATVVTLNVFSGRPNPSWVLSDAQGSEMQERVQAVEQLSTHKPAGVVGGLGYRGFLVTRHATAPSGPLAMHIHGGIVDPGPGEASLVAGDRAIETWLLGTGSGHVDPEVATHVQEHLRTPVALEASVIVAPKLVCPQCHAADAPVYNPGKWNIPSVQPYNNCYNYANDHITNTFAQPGRAHGHQATKMACPDVDAAAQADGLKNTPNFTGTLTAGHGWYVALVVWPNVDYHWYRQDKVGCWSHKPGGTAARNVDNSNQAITDPKTCNRGPYTQFCGYLITTKSVVIK